MTAAGMIRLKEAMPHAEFEQFESDPDVNKMPDLFTVKTIVNFVEMKLQTA